MGEIVLWLIQAPAKLVAVFIVGLWPLLNLGAAIGLGMLVYNVAGGRSRHWLSLPLSIVLGLYSGMVLYEAQKWTGLEFLEAHRGGDDF